MPPYITLVSCDGTRFTNISIESAKLCQLIGNILCLEDRTDEIEELLENNDDVELAVIDCPRVDSNTLKLIVDFINYYPNNKIARVMKKGEVVSPTDTNIIKFVKLNFADNLPDNGEFYVNLMKQVNGEVVATTTGTSTSGDRNNVVTTMRSLKNAAIH